MRRRRYGYTFRSRRPAAPGGVWWLAVAVVVVGGAIALNSRLPEDGGGSLLAVEAEPECGDECAPAVALPVGCRFGGDCAPLEFGPPVPADTGPPEITAAAAAVIEEPCGALLHDHNAHQRRAPASLTKIATALVAHEQSDLSEIVDVRVDGAELAAETDSTVMGLESGQRLSVRDLLYGLLLPSGNDAAIALAEHVSGSEAAFTELMNSVAERLGLTDSHFSNAHGLDDPGLYASAFDIATLGRELMRRPELAEIVSTPVYQPAWELPPVWNGNRLLQLYPGAMGVKIGFTDEAGQTIVAMAEQEGRTVIVSVLGSSAVYSDAITLLDWAFYEAPSGCGSQSVAAASAR